MLVYKLVAITKIVSCKLYLYCSRTLYPKVTINVVVTTEKNGRVKYVGAVGECG